MIDLNTVKYTKEQRESLNQKIQDLSPWYHSFDFGDGVKAQGHEFDFMWDMTKRLLSHLDYTDKTVLDLASWDGYWAFHAEQKGAKEVVSSDIVLRGFKNLLFCREVFQSNIIPLCNVPVQDLSERLKVIGLPQKYDFIQHFGLFYHLRDPMMSLTQARMMIEDDGLLILETPILNDDENSYMAFSGGIDGKYHFYGPSDTWVPTSLCMKEMLYRSGFEPVMEEIWQQCLPNNGKPLPDDRLPVARTAMVARAFPLDRLNRHDYNKMFDATG